MLFHKDSDRHQNRMYIDSVLRNREDMGLELESMGLVTGEGISILHSERGEVTFYVYFSFFLVLMGEKGEGNFSMVEHEINIPMTAQK